MAGLVLDSSFALALVLPDETIAPEHPVNDWLAESGAAVPPHWHIEVGNGLLVAERRKRIFTEDMLAALNAFDRISIEVDADHRRSWAETFDLARHHCLTLYDAAYLELAIRLGLPLATLDSELIAAAKAEQVPLITANA